MTAAVAGRVAAGMELMDKLDPGWWRPDVGNAVDLGRLTIRRSRDCVLGQRHGDYVKGLKALKLWTATDEHGINRAAEARGFQLAMAGTAGAHDELAARGGEWVRVIRERRSAR